MDKTDLPTVVETVSLPKPDVCEKYKHSVTKPIYSVSNHIVNFKDFLGHLIKLDSRL